MPESREELTAAIWHRLKQVTEEDFSPVLEPGATDEARQLSQALMDNDLEARYLLGWLHWYRAQAALTRGHDSPDLDTSISMFIPCFVAGIDHLPGPALPLLADSVAADASSMLQSEGNRESVDPTLWSRLVQLWQRILRVTPADSTDLSTRLSALGLALIVQFDLTGEPSDLDGSIEATTRALELTSADPPGRAVLQSNLGDSLHTRYERTGKVADLDASIELLEQALVVIADDHIIRPQSLTTLHRARRSRFERTGELADLDAMIGVLRQAARNNHVLADQPRTLLELGIALQERFELTREQTDLDAAIDACEQALSVIPGAHWRRNIILAELAHSLRTRFELTGTLADIDAAIDNLQLIIASDSDPDLDRAFYLSRLGSAFRSRFEWTKALNDLHAAVQFNHDAVAADTQDRPALLTNLAGALRSRFERMGAIDDIDAAIRHLKRVVELTPEDNPFPEAMDLSNLANALHARFNRTRNQADLEAAAETIKQAAAVAPADDPDTPVIWSSLSNIMLLEYNATKDPADLEAAIEASEKAVAATPEDHPNRTVYLSFLGDSLHMRFRHSGLQEELAAAFEAYAEAAETHSAAPSRRIEIARDAARQIAPDDPDRAAALLETAVRLLPEVASRRLRRSDQQYLLTKFDGLASDAAALVLSEPARPRPDRPARALMLLETGRGVLLSQALATRTDLSRLQQSYPDLAARFADLRDRLDRLPGQYGEGDRAEDGTLSLPPRTASPEAGHRRLIASQLAETVKRIRELDASFGRPPSVEDLLAQATEGPVVTFNIGARGDALILTPAGVTPVELPGLTRATVIEQTKTFQRALRIATDIDITSAERRAAQKILRTTLEWIWDTAAEPVFNSLGLTAEPAPGTPWTRVWWAPGGLLGLLPLHAAGYHTDPPGARRTIIDRAVSSYTPTIRALGHARQRYGAMAGGDTPAADALALIVAMRTTPGLGEHGLLRHVSAEAAAVTSHLLRHLVLAEPHRPGPDTADPAAVPTKSNVLFHLPACTIAHFACHGRTDPADPSQNQLLLHDHATDPFTVASLAPTHVANARLVFLSACHTAFTGARLLDESIHLASAFQLAGFPHVIGTLWEVNDEAAVDIAAAFYGSLCADPHAIDISYAAHALHNAVRSLRDRFPITPSLWASYLHSGA